MTFFSSLKPLASGQGRGYNAMHMEIDQSYQETLDYLYSFIDYSLQKTYRYSAEKFDLGRMRDFMASLGNPERDYKVIHVAGTKGKGSVAALCASAIKENGYRVGLYTSPHLEDFTERIQVNGEPISSLELTELVEEIKPFVAAIPELTTFEITTALAFLHFSRQEVEVAVLEVGLGGRLDATNVCEPDVTVITSISYDHTDLLGDTLAEIAGEKAGIIKAKVPVVVSPQPDGARRAIEQIAAEREAPLIRVGEDLRFKSLSRNFREQTLKVWTSEEYHPLSSKGIYAGDGRNAPVDLTIPLLGDHQVENAAVAFAALQVFQANGVPLREGSIQNGFRGVRWPGRFEILQESPPVIIDSAHNRDSAQKLRRTLDQYYPDQPILLVFGASEDKDIQGMLAELTPIVELIIATKSTHPRAIDPQKIVEMAREFECPAISCSTIEEALVRAEQDSGARGLTLISGSIFVAAAARSIWRESHSEKNKSFVGNKL
jgi:dihydrofolate synthase/folylpolyglutamate synthase